MAIEQLTTETKERAIETLSFYQIYFVPLSLVELEELSDKLRDDVIDLGRRTVEKSWELGGVLLAAKDQVDHGDWMPWLADRLISHDIAKRLMKLHAGYPQKVQIALFDSVNVALKRLPAKTDPERIATQRPPATATNGKVIEMVERSELVAAQREIEGLKGYILRAETDLAKERTEVKRLTHDLAQALDENRKLKEVIASYEGATKKEKEEHLWEN